jgi:hypothetical protein
MGAALLGSMLVTADASDCLHFWRCGEQLAFKDPPKPLLRKMPEASNLQGTQEHIAAEPGSLQDLPAGQAAEPKASPISGAVYKETELSIRHAALPETWTGSAPDPQTSLTAPRLNCNFVVGLSAAVQNGTLWLPPQGLVVHAVDNTIVVNELHTGRQRYLTFNQQQISCLASVDCASSVFASASECDAAHPN